MQKIALRKKGGRNNQGRITVRGIGGGFKRRIRLLEYRKKSGEYISTMSGEIEAIEKDPNRTGYLAVCKNEHGKIYKIAGGIGEPKPGMKIEVQTLGGVYVGDSIYNVSIKPGKIGQYARAAGASCKVLKQDEGGTTIIRLPSSEVKRLNSKNECQRGIVYGKAKERLGTAGANRRLGVRPRVQGVAMNPIDHPNGGKSPSSKVKNLWGKLAKWVKTRKSRLKRK